MKRFTIRQGNNMPVQSPLIPDPFVPYQCKNNKILSVVCRGDRKVIDRWLKPTPFESVSDRYIVSIADFSNCDKASYMDAAIVLPIKFRNKFGGYYFFEYENNDSACGAIPRNTPRSRWSRRARKWSARPCATVSPSWISHATWRSLWTVCPASS
jgi:acetoacetate decarboxylase